MNTPSPSAAAGTPCPNCGTPLRGPFCTTCGQPADTPVQRNARYSQPAPPPPSGAYPTQPQPAPYSGAYPTQPQSPLPSGAFQTVPIPPARTPAEPGSIGRVFLIGALALVLLVGLGVGGVFGFQWWRDRPMTSALDTSAAAVTDVTGKLEDADDLAGLSAAGAAAPKSAATIKKALASIKDEEGKLADLTRDVLEDQIALMEAIAPMEGLSATSLTVWGTTQPAVAEAQSEALTSRRALADFEKGIGDDVPDPRPATTHAAEVVATQAGDALTSQLEQVLSDMADVANTGQAAALGERTSSMGTSADAAKVGQSGSAAATLGHLSDAFAAVNKLSDMDPEALYLWGDAKSDLATATDALGIDSSTARDSMSAWVETAQERMDQWRIDYEEAESQRSSATTDLDSYSEDMKRILRAYNRARDATADALGQEDASSYDIEWAMEEGVSTRQALVEEIEYLYVPDGLDAMHTAVVGLIQSGVDAMVVGEMAVEEWNACYYDCADDFRDTSGWQEFSRESARITTDFDTARKTWVSALESALGKANAVPLPPMPDV